jgi:hypothetical protein
MSLVVLAATACEEEFVVRPPLNSRDGTVVRSPWSPVVASEGAEEPGWSRGVASGAPGLEALARRAAEREGLDPELVFAVIDVESNWNPRARSYKDARGLMQLLPSTARRYGVYNPVHLYDPETNLRAGTAHLRDLLDEFCDVALALWAYHAGADRVRGNRTVGYISPPESARYVRMVVERYAWRRRSRGLGEPDLRGVAGCGGPQWSSERVANSEPTPTRVAPVPEPVAQILNALLAGVEADEGGFFVRVGEPVTLELRASNAGGPAQGGKITLRLIEHPRLRLGHETSMANARVAQTGSGTVVEASADAWGSEREHWLRVRLIPQDAGDLVLSYAVALNAGFGRTSTYPPEGSGRVVRIRVTRTSRGGDP